MLFDKFNPKAESLNRNANIISKISQLNEKIDSSLKEVISNIDYTKRDTILRKDSNSKNSNYQDSSK